MRKELNMIYVTGDTHANIDIAKLNTTKFPQQKELTKNDFVIICGDFGLCWDGSHREMWWQDWLTAKTSRHFGLMATMRTLIGFTAMNLKQ